ncbi:MAG TPA: type I DNA topoisomerase [Phototrophicaceae bacterium]|nr:type I DNA topoisomerase [Phototrophicaceae bacterium]
MTLEAYCVKCKTKREIANPQPVWTARGTPAVKGTCPVCGTTLFHMGATEAHATLPKPVVETAAKPARKSAAKSKATKTSKTKAKTKSKTTTKATSKTTVTAKAKTAKKSTASKADKKAPEHTIGKLVIVESPAKARSVGQFLGKGYTVKASKGHVRDLLVSQISVDVEHNFEPKYRVMNDQRDTVKDLKSAAERANEIYLATDPDREGEAIAWHLLAATELEDQPKMPPIKRVVFHEITKPAIQDAFGHPRDIDMNLVNAQQARRILDRLVGYQVTELLWEKVRNRLSAGRVQSIAVRLIVDREREVENFVQQEYWTLDAQLKKQHHNGKSSGKPFIARLIKIGDKDVEFTQKSDVEPHLAILEKSRYAVADIKRGERVRKPSAPFTTSTLQQEASRRLGFTAKRTMAVAQQLYEGIDVGAEGSIGLITYMRTDSLSISPQAHKEAREYIEKRFGKEFMPARAPIYRTKSKGAQEAHEAIRPTGVMREPDAIKKSLSPDQYRLYNLIWQRFVASQMQNAIYNTLRVDIDAGLTDKSKPYHFRVSGSTIKFSGFLALYEDAHDEDVAADEDEGRILPEMSVNEALDLLGLLPEQHFTQPPPRYTEASIVRTLEEYGIGRPSTYAPTVAVIQDREYVAKKDKRLIPTETGRIVNDLLVQYFPEIMDYQFTAKMEDELDEISEGRREWRPMLHEFYGPFESELKNARQVIEPINHVEEVGRACPVCGKPLVIRYGRFGKFIGCSDYPNCRHTEPFLERMGIPCPICGVEHGGEIIERRSKRGRVFYGCSRYPDCEFTSWQKPLAQPCPNCGGLLVEASRNKAECTVCKHTFQIDKLPAVESPELA